MKNWFYLFSICFFPVILLTSSTMAPDISDKYEIKIDGVEAKHGIIIKEGISKEELGEMTIHMKKGKSQVIIFNVTLARGPRPVGSTNKVKGNEFDLSTYSEWVKSGDRISIEILEVGKKRNRKSKKVKDYLTFPIR